MDQQSSLNIDDQQNRPAILYTDNSILQNKGQKSNENQFDFAEGVERMNQINKQTNKHLII